LFVDKEKILLKTNKVPTVLMVLDGWGVSTGKGRDAIAGAATPVMDRLAASYPSTALGAAGLDVGLPENQIGNSEVGHLNLGAGRVVYQDFTRINKAVETGEFFENPVLLEMFSTVKQASGRLHIMGLLSDGGVHSHIDHIKAVAAMASDNGVSSIYLHARIYEGYGDLPCRPQGGKDGVSRGPFLPDGQGQQMGQGRKGL
jgi:2,3-bisphosphoglycerate-independent phosphoglycerate mutase